MDIKTFNRAIHGNFLQPWDVKMSHATLEELDHVFSSSGLVVTKKRTNGIKLIVEAERP